MDELLAVLRSTPDDAMFWTWSPGQPCIAFLRRRMAHETAVHRWDCEAAYGRAQPIESRLAADGVDELLTDYLQRWGRPAGSGQPVALRTSDTVHEWTVLVGDGTLETRRELEGGAPLVTGRASDLLLALWGRLPLGDLEIVGDAAPLKRLLAAADLD